VSTPCSHHVVIILSKIILLIVNHLLWLIIILSLDTFTLLLEGFDDGQVVVFKFLAEPVQLLVEGGQLGGQFRVERIDLGHSKQTL